MEKMDLIDRADVKRLLLENAYDDGFIDMRVDELIDEVNGIPSARPKGKWIDITKCGGASLWKCSECGELFLEDFYYCPNCGAEMETDNE